MSSEVEGGLCDLHKASASHRPLRERQRIPLLLPHSSPSSRIIIRAKAKDSSSLLLYHWSTAWGGAGDRNKALFKRGRTGELHNQPEFSPSSLNEQLPY